MARYRASFLPTNEHVGWFECTVDLCYWLDVLLLFSTGYGEGGYHVVMDKQLIKRHYLDGWFGVRQN